MQIAVCDDEKGTRDFLAEKIQMVCPKAEVLVYNSGDALLLSASQPDILFLDIQMPGRNGIDTAIKLRKKWKDTVLIFVTAIEDYVFQAFDVGAFHYLVKPFDNKKFVEILMKAVRCCEDKRQHMEDYERKVPCLMITTGGKHFTVNLKDIMYAEVFDRKIILHTVDADIEYYGKMKDLEKEAGEEFYRPHRAYLVNFNYVRKYDATTIYLEKGRVLMAKKNYQDFVKCYLKYNRERGRQ